MAWWMEKSEAAAPTWVTGKWRSQETREGVWWKKFGKLLDC